MSRLNRQRTPTERIRDLEDAVAELRRLVQSRTGYVLRGAGSPAGVKSAPPGTLFLDSANGEVYVKDSGTGTAGWRQL